MTDPRAPTGVPARCDHRRRLRNHPEALSHALDGAEHRVSYCATSGGAPSSLVIPANQSITSRCNGMP